MNQKRTLASIMSSDALNLGPVSTGSKAIAYLADYIHLPQYLKTKWRGILNERHLYSADRTAEFWSDAKDERIKPNDVVRLENVILTEWFPRAPGAHFGWQKGSTVWKRKERGVQRQVELPKAGPQMGTGYWAELMPPKPPGSKPLRKTSLSESRSKSRRMDLGLPGGAFPDETHIFNGSEDFVVLEPERKTFVVLSGFGNLRFSEKPVGRLLSAVGNSYGGPNAAEGIPLLVRPQEYDKLADGIRRGLVVDIEGVYAKLPDEIDSRIWKVKGIPRYCVLVESHMLIDVKKKYSGPLACYAWTLFEYPGSEGAEYAFAYAPFDASKPDTINVATDFIEQYLRRYKGSAITDFDEEVPRLEAQVKIGDLMNDRIDFAKLDQKMAAVRDAVENHNSQMLLMAIRAGGPGFVAP